MAKELRLVLNPFGKEALKVLSSCLSYFLPKSFVLKVIQFSTGQKEHEAEITYKLVNSYTVENTVSMGIIEMQEIKELDEKFYRQNIDRIYMYDGEDDKWAPLEYYERMKSRFPTAHVELCRHGLPHAFVLGEGGLLMAERTFEMIHSALPK
jgi:hypothetical protein